MSKYPILFESNETEFETHGIGVLSDAMQCDVTEELNGIFELNMVYPSDGRYIKELKNARLIYADAGRELGNQPFRICRITKLLNGFINVYAQHISYDLAGIQLPPFETLSTADGMQKVKEYSITKNDYTFSSTVLSNPDDTFSIKTPKSVRAYLAGAKDSFLQAYGGEFTFDRFNVRHSTIRGSDKGFRVKYGVNLVDLNQEESIEATYTGIYPYYKDEYMFMDLTESYDLMYPHEIDKSKFNGKIVYTEGVFAHTKIANVDLSSYFEIAPLATTELKDVAEKYMNDNKIGVPRVSLDIRFESLRRSAEYSDVVFLEDVFLGDTIHVDFVKLGVSSSGRINSIIYDSLRHKNKRVSIGDTKSNVADTLVSITNSVKGSETNVLGLSRSVAKINLLTNQNSAAVELLVETQEDGKQSVRGSVLVEAINGQSKATIQADKVNLKGYVTIDSLKEGGSTVIDGSRIQTGRISSKNFSKKFTLLKTLYRSIDPGDYYFSSEGIKDDNDYPVYYTFTTVRSIPAGGQIRFYKETNTIETLDDDANILETLSATIGNNGTELEPDISIFFSENGTEIDLESGTILSKYFSVSENGAYFGGEIQVDYGRIGAFDVDKGGLTSVAENNSSIWYGGGGLYFQSTIESFSNNYVKMTIGEPSGVNIPGYTDPHKIKLTNSSGHQLDMSPTTADLIGPWKATPCSDASADVSEIVTKQDLINLGLITA